MHINLLKKSINTNMKDLLGTSCRFEMKITAEQVGETLSTAYKNTSVVPENEEEATC